METSKPNAEEILHRYDYVAGQVAEFMSMSPCIAFTCGHGFITGQIPLYNAETMWPTYYMFWLYTLPQIEECLNNPNSQHVRSVIENKKELMEQEDIINKRKTAIYKKAHRQITEDDLIESLTTMELSKGRFDTEI